MRTLHLYIESNLGNIPLAASCLRGLITQETPFNESERYDVELAVVEALTNIIKHAYAGKSGYIIHLALILYEDHFTVEIYDSGKTIDKKHTKEPYPPQLSYSLEELPESGWGLYLIQQCVDKVDYSMDENCNKLSLCKYFSA
jgi:serine/threonine-protein kinase RsbW